MSDDVDEKIKVKGQPKAGLTGVPIKYVDVGVLRIGRLKYAVKLNWTVLLKDMKLAEQAQDPSSAVDIPGGQSSAPVLAVKSADETFVGFASEELGHKNGFPSLALSVDREITGPNWAGVFPVEGENDMYWVGAVQADGVFEDDIVQGQDRAEEAFTRLTDVPGWDALFAPAFWNAEGTEDVPLSELLVSKPKLKVKYIQPIKARRGLIIGSSIFGAIAYFGLNFINDQLEAQRIEQQRLARLAAQAIDIGPEDYPWYGAPTPARFVTECLDQVEQKIVFVPGWEVAPFICRYNENQSTLTAIWQRRGGTSSWLRASMPDGDAAFSMDEAAGSGQLIQSFGFGEEFKRLDVPWEPNDITLRVQERFQPFEDFVSLDIRAQIDRPTPVRGTAIPQPVYNKHDIVLSGEGDPLQYIALLNTIPAVTPSIFTYNVANDGWTLAATIHHEVLIPEIRR